MTRRLALLAILALGASVPAPARAITSVVAFGDSITAGDAWVVALRDVYEVTDLGLGGETTAAGLVRLRAWIAAGPGATDFVTLLEGTNDFFRTAYSEAQTLANLEQMAAEVEAAGMTPVVVAPPPILTPGSELADARAAELAQKLAASAASAERRFVDLYARFRARPDLPTLYGDDGLHPNERGGVVIEAALREALDNCPGVDNPDQRDTSGNGIGDACRCGDVDGSGTITMADAALLLRALSVPPAATLPRPALCDVGGSVGCSSADAAILLRALLAPPRASITLQCWLQPGT